MEQLDLTFVDQVVEKVGTGKEKVLEILQAIQGHYGYLPQEALQRVCELTEITPASIAGVSTFYNQFRHRPAGRHIIHVCHGTACHVKGSELVQDAFRRHLEIPEGDDTDAQRLFTVEKVACLGCCTLAPVVQIDEVTYGHLTPRVRPQGPERLPPARAGPGGRAWDSAPAASSEAGLPWRDPHRAGLLLPGPRQRQAARRPAGRLGPSRRQGAGEAGRLRGHVPPDAAGGARAAASVLISLCPGAAGGRHGHRPAAFRRRSGRTGSSPTLSPVRWTGC